MSDFILNKEEIIELTGYQSAARQKRWLEARGWRFEVSAVGRVIIGRAYAEQKLGYSSSKPVERPAPTMNIDAIRSKRPRH